MKTPQWLAGMWAAILCTVMGMPSACAQLPALESRQWLGYFAVFANRHCQFCLSTQGKISLKPIGDKDEPVAKTLQIPIEIIIEEIRPNGKSTVKQIKPETLVSEQHPTAKLVTTVIRGKVTGDASFEITLEQNRGVISLGGRLPDPGTLTKNPLRFSLRVYFPSAYPHENQNDKNAAKAFQKKIKDDHINLTWTDGKRQTHSFDKKINASSKEINGPGIATAEIENSAYQGKKFRFTTAANATMTLSNTNPGPLHKGFAILWLPDPAKDSGGKARLSFEVK
jgi:hypothetical protein